MDEAPQNLPSRLVAGAQVVARGWPWRVRRSWTGDGCRVIEIDRLHRDAPLLAALLDPFDRVQALAAGSRWQRASRGRLSQQIASLRGAWSPQQPLAALASMRVPLWAHQRAPALAIVRGAATRLVVADQVGLGKTLSAALVVAELSTRALCQRALIVVPAGLRDQWREELEARAGLHATVMDAAALADRVRQRPSGECAWSAPGIAIVSIDFARQPSVLAGLAAWPWDVLVIDEAHQVSTDSARASAASRIARRSRVVLLLTATPHSGDPSAFRRLLALGGDGSPAAWFRHERSTVEASVPPRKTRRWRIRPTTAEARLLEALGAYTRRVDRGGHSDARLAMLVLRKRALSSASALACSLEHRRAALAGAPGEQLALPLDPSQGEHETADVELPASLAAPGLDDRGGELTLLDGLTSLAWHASGDASKWRTIDRLIRRTSEPVIFFTEYRDTLRSLVDHLGGRTPVVVLHGGLDREQRGEAISRFTRGDVRVLVATDAAAEGLNLQARCRLLVNVELPWSPRVLEQRAGRIDRIGQRQAVHVWELAGRSGHEGVVTAALARRMAAIESDVSGTSPGDAQPEDETPALARGLEASPGASTATLTAWWRLIKRGSTTCAKARAPSRRAGPVWMRARRARWMGRGVLIVFSAEGECLAAATEHVAVHVSMKRLPPGSPKRWLPLVADAARPAASNALGVPSALANRLAARERELLDFAVSAHTATTRRWQPSFFDRRTERVVEAARLDLTRLTIEHQRRLAELDPPASHRTLNAVLAIVVP
jgi:superfamily II DNA or RNA helicase